MTARGGQTIGKKIFNIKVAGREGQAISFKQSIARFFCYFLSIATFFIGFILPFFNREKKALHDYVVKTKVIYVGQPTAKNIIRVAVDASLVILFLILAFLIVAPKFAGILEKSREGATKGNLNQIKENISNYHAQHSVWPQTLENPLPVKATGAYVRGSKNPAGKKVTLAHEGEVPTTSGKGWLYDSNLGIIYVNSTVKDSKSIAYSFYGFE
jgi:hypothetical protein